MAHKKGLGSSKNGRDSNAQRLGVKVFGGQLVPGGQHHRAPARHQDQAGHQRRLGQGRHAVRQGHRRGGVPRPRTHGQVRQHPGQSRNPPHSSQPPPAWPHRRRLFLLHVHRRSQNSREGRRRRQRLSRVPAGEVRPAGRPQRRRWRPRRRRHHGVPASTPTPCCSSASTPSTRPSADATAKAATAPAPRASRSSVRCRSAPWSTTKRPASGCTTSPQAGERFRVAKADAADAATRASPPPPTRRPPSTNPASPARRSGCGWS